MCSHSYHQSFELKFNYRYLGPVDIGRWVRRRVVRRGDQVESRARPQVDVGPGIGERINVDPHPALSRLTRSRRLKVCHIKAHV